MFWEKMIRNFGQDIFRWFGEENAIKRRLAKPPETTLCLNVLFCNESLVFSWQRHLTDLPERSGIQEYLRFQSHQNGWMILKFHQING